MYLCTFMILLYKRKHIIHKRKVIKMFLNKEKLCYLMPLSKEAGRASHDVFLVKMIKSDCQTV